MKFLANRSNGRIIGRLNNDRLTFPIPSDVVVFESPTDISEKILSSGSTLEEFSIAKISSFRSLHPLFTHSFAMNEEFIVPNCDLTNSNFITRGPGKTTVIRPGGRLVSEPIICGQNIGMCMRYGAFIMGSPHGRQNLRYYDYDETLQDFTSPPSLTATLVDAIDPMNVLVNVAFDVEEPQAYLPDFRVSFYNNNPNPVFVSNWTFISYAPGFG